MSGVKHAFSSAIADDVSPGGKVQPSHWNADHDLSGLTPADLPVAIRPRGMPGIFNGYLTSFLPFTNGVTTAAFAANESYLVPIVIPFDCTIEASIRVTVAGSAGAKATVALYKNNGGTLTAEHVFNEFATDSTGIKYSTDSYAIKAGQYWVFTASSAVYTGTYIAGAATNGFPMSSTTDYSQIGPRFVVTRTYSYPPPTNPTFTITPSASGVVDPALFRVS